MTAAIILAAGASTRLGEPKQLAMLGQEPLLERSVRAARNAGCDPVVVVLGAAASQIRERCNLENAIVLLNQQWQEGMASSIRAGVNAAPGADGILLMTCDQPAVTAAHLRTLIAADRVCASAYSGRRGVPAYFPAALFPDLLRLTGDTGARGLLQDAPAIELAGGDLDVDTGEQLSHARELFG